MHDLVQKIEALPPALQQQVEDFVDFLRTRHAQQKREPMRFDWVGALADLRDEYTSVELQHKALEWRED